MTNWQAKGYLTCAVYAIYRDNDRTDFGKYTATDQELKDLLSEIREEMDYQFDILTEEEAEDRGGEIMRML